jgi:hypothetical protein
MGLNPIRRVSSRDLLQRLLSSETERVICSSAALFFRPKETGQGSLEGNLCGFKSSKAHRKAEE